MKRLYWILAFALLAGFRLMGQTTPNSFAWAKGFGTTSNDNPILSAADSAGNIFAIGYSTTIVHFGANSYTPTNPWYIVKYDSTGQFLWAHTLFTAGTFNTNAIECDGSGNVIITGTYSGILTCGAFSLPSGSNDMAIIKLDNNGTALWMTYGSGPGTFYPGDFSIAADNQGNIYVGGGFSQTLTIQSSSVSTIYPLSSVTDGFWLKLTAAGTLVWIYNGGATHVNTLFQITVDAQQNVYFTGSTSVSETFGSFPVTLQNGGNPVQFFAKCNSAGQVLFVKSAGCDNFYCFVRADDNTGDIYFLGDFYGYSRLITTDTMYTYGSSGNNDLFLIKYDANGNRVWQKPYGGTGTDRPYGFEIGHGHLYIGFYAGPNDSLLHLGNYSASLPNTDEAIIAFLDTAGNGQVIAQAPHAAQFGITKSNNGYVFSYGYFNVPAPVFNSITLTTVGGQDLYVARLNTFGINDAGAVGLYDTTNINCTGNHAFAVRAASYTNTPITGCTMNWSVNGVLQSPVTFAGTINSFDTTSIINLGVFNFTQAGNYLVKAWTSNPSGFGDATTYNDTSAITVNISPVVPVISSIGPTSVCAPQSVSLTLNGNFSNLLWSNSLTADTISVSVTDTLSITATDSNGCVSTSLPFIVSILAQPSVAVTASGPLTFCLPQQLVLSATTGFSQYQWSNSGTFDTLQVNQSGNYSVIVTDANGCSDTSQTFAISVYPQASVTITAAGPLTFCLPGSVLLQATAGFSSYAWSNAAVTDTTSAYSTGSYWLTATDLHGCTATDTVMVNADTCSLVWPGNANKDTIVDNNDFLCIGLYNGATGYPRSTISNVWQGNAALNWGTLQSNGHDMKFADSDGDGSVTLNDTVAINLNYGLLDFSPARMSSHREAATGPPLFFATNASTYYSGDWIDVYVWAGDTTQPINSLYGGAFKINFTQGVTDASTTSLTFPNSWLGVPGTDAIHLQQTFESQGRVDGSLIRFDHNGRTGYGPIAVMHFRANSLIAQPTVVNFSFLDYQLVDSLGNSINITPINDSILILPVITSLPSINGEMQCTVFPNPASNAITMELYLPDAGEYVVQVTDMLGQTVINEKRNAAGKGDQNTTLDVSNLVQGTYVISVRSASGIISRRMIISR